MALLLLCVCAGLPADVVLSSPSPLSASSASALSATPEVPLPPLPAGAAKLNAIPPPTGSAVKVSAAAAAAGTPPASAAPSGFSAQRPEHGLSAPLYLTAIAGNGSVELSWYPSFPAAKGKPVAGYLIFRALAGERMSPEPINLSEVAKTYYTDDENDSDSEPLDRHNYFYRVRAYDTDGLLSPYSLTVSARPSGPLLPPRRFRAVPGDGQTRLLWGPPLSTGDADLADYVLLRGADGAHLSRYRILAPDTVSFTDKGVEDGRALYYALEADTTDHKHSSPTNPVRAVPYKPLAVPTGLSGLGLGEDIVRLTWNAPDSSGGTFPLQGYNIYRSTGAAVDYGAPPLNRVLVTGTRYEDDSDNSVSPVAMGDLYRYTVVSVDSNGDQSAPSKPSKAGPVASITKLEAGTFDVLSGNTLQIQGRKTISASDTWMLWRQNLGNTYGSNPPTTFALTQQLQVQLSGQVGRKIKVDVDYDDSAASTQQQKISVVYGGDDQEIVKQFAFGDIQMNLDSSRTQFANYNKSLFGAQLQIASPDDKLRITAVGAQTQGFTETKTFVGGYEEVMNGSVPGSNYPDTSFIPYQYYYLSREEDLVEGGNSVVPGSVAIYVDEPGVSNLASNRVTVTNAGTTFNFIPLNANLNYTVNYKTGLVTFNTPMQANYNIAVAYKTAGTGGNGAVSVGYDAAGKVALGDGLGNASADAENLNDNLQSGTTDEAHQLIQFGSQNGSAVYDGHMSCQFYSMGNQEILDPSQDPNFKFIIYGPNNAVVYQLDSASDYTSVVNFNTTLGIMTFRVPYPFQQSNTQTQMTANAPGYSDVGVLYNGSSQDCYNLVTRVSNYTIHVEYQHKMTDYQLRPNIVNGSDVVTVNGKHVIRNVDYFLDYSTGILVFNNPDLVSGNATVQATYEYLPFGNQFTSTVYGARGEYDFSDDLSVGSTYINDSANAPQDTPQIGSGVYSLQILDGDVEAQVPQKTLDAITRPISPRSDFLSIKASAEAASSWYSPNTYQRNNENGVAMVDDFESVNSIVSGSTLRDTWFPASIPVSYTALVDGVPGAVEVPDSSGRRFTHLWTNQLQAYDAAVLTEAGDDPLVNMLQLDWSKYAGPDNWDGYVYSFGPTPNQSISQSNQIQIWLKVTAPVTLHVDCGQMNEDAVDNGALATESSTGYLAAGEDIGTDNPSTIGSPYPCPQDDPAIYPDPGYWGANNSILDTEDFDQTGVLDTVNNYYGFSAALTTEPQDTGDNNGYQEVTFDMTQQQALPGIGYNLVAQTTPLSRNPGDSNYYTNVTRLRIWVDGAGASSGSLVIESVQFVGNKWQVRADPNTVSAAGVSNTVQTNFFQVQDVNQSAALSTTAEVPYVPDTDFYTVDSTHSQSVESALELLYATTKAQLSPSGEPFYQARRILSTNGTPVDFGQYQNMRLDVFKPNYNSASTGYRLNPNGVVVTNFPGETLLVRLAADDEDYFEYAIPLDSVGAGNWQTETLALNGSDGSRIQVGTPYLRQINYVSFSVRGLNTLPNAAINTPGEQEALWLNNLRVTDPLTLQGGAQRFDINYSLMGGKITVDQSYKEVDSNFIQIDQQDNPPLQHTINQAVSANVNVLKWLPTTASYTADQLFTDSGNEGDPFYSQNFTDPNQSDNKTSVSTALQGVPGLDLSANGYVQHVRQLFLPAYTAAEEENLGLDFNPDNTQNNTQEQIQAGYKLPEKLPVLGGNQLKASVQYSTTEVAFDQPITITGTTQFANTSTETRTIQAGYNASYRIGKWLIVSPSYNYSEVEADGNIAAPTALLGQTQAYTLDAYGRVSRFTPQQRVINPQVQVQLGSLGPVQNTKMDYNFTQTMDYVQNQMETPGSVDAATSLNFADLGSRWKALPSLNLSQSWQVDSVISDDITVRGPVATAYVEQGIMDDPVLASQFASWFNNPNVGLQEVPDLALESRAPWYQSVWMPRLGFAGNDFWGGPLDIENLATSASRRSTTSLSSHFTLTIFPGWTGDFTPRASYSDARTMSSPEQITENEQTSVGTDIAFQNPHIPFHDFLRPDNLTFDGSFTYAENWIDDVETAPALSSVATSYNAKFSLPMRPSKQATITASLAAAASTNVAYEDINNSNEVSGNSDTLSLTPGLRLVYLLNMTRPIRLPNFWPFYGREMKLSQAVRLDNNLQATINDSYQNATSATLEDTASNLYTLTNTVAYNVLENVQVNFSLEQDYMQDPDASQAINQPGGYYSIKLTLGAEATF